MSQKTFPLVEERRHSTVEDIKRQLAYLEANKAKVQFAVVLNMRVENNPDIVNLSQVTSCKFEVTENRHEETYKDKAGNTKSYTLPRYTFL